MRGQVKSGVGSKEMDHLRNQFQFFIAREIAKAIEGALKTNAAIAGLQNDSIIIASFDADAGAQ